MTDDATRLSRALTRCSEILQEEHDVDHGRQICRRRLCRGRPIHAMHLCLLSDRPTASIYKHNLLNLIFLIALPRRSLARSHCPSLLLHLPSCLSSLRSSTYVLPPPSGQALPPCSLSSHLVFVYPATHPRPRSPAAIGPPSSMPEYAPTAVTMVAPTAETRHD